MLSRKRKKKLLGIVQNVRRKQKVREETLNLHTLIPLAAVFGMPDDTSDFSFTVYGTGQGTQT